VNLADRAANTTCPLLPGPKIPGSTRERESHPILQMTMASASGRAVHESNSNTRMGSPERLRALICQGAVLPSGRTRR